MKRPPFWTEEGTPVPAVTEEEMREVDRLAVESFHLDILQMMENAGRSLAQIIMSMLGDRPGSVVILVGSGANGGGGLCCARHLSNHGILIELILGKETTSLMEATRRQLKTLQEAGIFPKDPINAESMIRSASVVVDALIGYGMKGSPRGLTAELIDLCNLHVPRVISLDIPSGMNATTGETPGVFIQPERTLTLALPKTGLRNLEGEIYLADIGIPPGLYQHLGIELEPFFDNRYWIRLVTEQDNSNPGIS